MEGFYSFAYRNEDGTYYAPLIHRCETAGDVEWLQSMHQQTIDACQKDLDETQDEKKQAVLKVQLDLLKKQELVKMTDFPVFRPYIGE